MKKLVAGAYGHNRVLSFAMTILAAGLVLMSPLASGQSNRHWTRNFNEESSLLSGAVVGGGIGPSAIYFNPAGISESQHSSLSFHASLFSFEFYDMKHALGDDIHLESSRGIVQPRFISYQVQPKKYKNFSFEIAYLNNEIFKLQMTTAVDKKMDILNSLPGDERYFTNFSYFNNYREDWIGAGGAWKLGENKNIYLGISMFVEIKLFEYGLGVDIEAFPLEDTVWTSNEPVLFYSANYQEVEYIKYDNYRLVWKVGMLYLNDRYSLGFTFKTPSVNVLSFGNKVTHKLKQSNITFPYSDEFMPDFVIVDYAEDKEVKVNAKDPFSIAVGGTFYSEDRSRTLFTTIEYFHGLDPYKSVDVNANPESTVDGIIHGNESQEWLSFASGARPVLNAAAGYRWKVHENLLLMFGFRTDFNYLKDYDYEDYEEINVLKGLALNVYHLTGGLRIRILGQDIITGLQYSIGREKGSKQFINLSDPVEYNPIEEVALQGTRQNNMRILYNSISIYFGATFNFLGKDGKD